MTDSVNDLPQSADPGDATASRYNYQYTVAAMLACAMLADLDDIEEVFCEHHEDVLLRHRDQTFTGCQVKTRAEHLEQWRARDEEITSACSRFAQLERDHSTRFRAYRLATNHGFRHAPPKVSLPHILSLAKSTNGTPLPDVLDQYAKAIARASGCSLPTVLAALRKCALVDSLPKLDHVLAALRDTIGRTWSRGHECTITTLSRAAFELRSECASASGLDHVDVLPPYLGITGDPVQVELRARLDGKRITRERLEAALQRGLAPPALLDGDPVRLPAIAAGNESVLEQKLSRGGFSAVSVNAAIDLRAKADYQALSWWSRLGEEGRKRRDHIRTVVLRDAATAHEQTKSETEPFGLNMLQHLRSRFAARRTEAGAALFDCLDEHLEGNAYALTSECKIWWSTQFTPEAPA